MNFEQNPFNHNPFDEAYAASLSREELEEALATATLLKPRSPANVQRQNYGIFLFLAGLRMRRLTENFSDKSIAYAELTAENIPADESVQKYCSSILRTLKGLQDAHGKQGSEMTEDLRKKYADFSDYTLHFGLEQIGGTIKEELSKQLLPDYTPPVSKAKPSQTPKKNNDTPDNNVPKPSSNVRKRLHREKLLDAAGGAATGIVFTSLFKAAAKMVCGFSPPALVISPLAGAAFGALRAYQAVKNMTEEEKRQETHLIDIKLGNRHITLFKGTKARNTYISSMFYGAIGGIVGGLISMAIVPEPTISTPDAAPITTPDATPVATPDTTPAVTSSELNQSVQAEVPHCTNGYDPSNEAHVIADKLSGWWGDSSGTERFYINGVLVDPQPTIPKLGMTAAQTVANACG